MTDFGNVSENTPLVRRVEAVGAALSKLGGPGATDVILGANATPAVLLNSSTQFLSTRILAPLGWDTTQDLTANVSLALDGLQADADTFDLEFNYQYVRAGASGVADLNKTRTVTIQQLTVSSGQGLLDETIYNLSFGLDRNDVDNPYVNETNGGITVCINIDASGSIPSMNILGIFMDFPVLY